MPPLPSTRGEGWCEVAGLAGPDYDFAQGPNRAALSTVDAVKNSELATLLSGAQSVTSSRRNGNPTCHVDR